MNGRGRWIGAVVWASMAGLGGSAQAALGPPSEVARVTATTTSLSATGQIAGVGSGTPSLTLVPGGVLTPPTSTLAVLNGTPAPTYAWSTDTGDLRANIGGNPADSTVAASRTHICITTRAAFGCYAKAGTPVRPGAGLGARPYTAQDFFAASGVPIGTAYDGATGAGSVAKDGRVVYDQTRRRFFMNFQTRENPARVMIAVSKSEDPRDGWWTYADVVGRPGAELQDYQITGINQRYFLVSQDLVPPGGARVGVHFMYDADDLAAGRPYTRSTWEVPDARLAAPAVHDSPTDDTFWVTRVSDTQVKVWGLRGGDAIRYRTYTVRRSRNPIEGEPQPGCPNGGACGVDYALPDVFRRALNAQYRNGKLLFVSNDGATILVGTGMPFLPEIQSAVTNSALRIVRIDVSGFFAPNPSPPVEIDRLYPAPGEALLRHGADYDYGWPAVTSNAAGDIIIGAVRSSPSVFPEFRAAVWYRGERDLRNDTLVQQGAGALRSFHMAGASADPSTDGAYISQQVGDPTQKPAWTIRVAKILGARRPDLVTTAVTPPALAPPGPLTAVAVRVANEGDAPMPASSGRLLLGSSPTLSDGDSQVGSFSVPGLQPGEARTIEVALHLPALLPIGPAYLGPELDVDDTAREYSEDNNLNPLLEGRRGNLLVNFGPRG